MAGKVDDRVDAGLRFYLDHMAPAPSWVIGTVTKAAANHVDPVPVVGEALGFTISLVGGACSVVSYGMCAFPAIVAVMVYDAVRD